MDHPIVQIIKSKLACIKSFEDLTYLDLSDIKCDVLPFQVKSLLEKCPNLYQLDLSNCGLQSLDNLPHIEITILKLSSNHLNDTHLQNLTIYKSSLESLSLERNQLQNINNLSIFQTFPQLQQLNLKQNPLCQSVQNYSQKVFQEILRNNQSLRLVDYFMKNGEILSDQEGKDQFLDGPEWLLKDSIEEELPNNQDAADEQNNSQQSQEQMDNPNKLMKLYQQNNKINPTFIVEYLNKNCKFVDPIDNCLDEQGESFQQEDSDQEEFQKQIENGEFNCKQSKKRKVEIRFDENQEY